MEVQVTPYFEDAGIRLYHGDVLETLKQLPAESINCCITSPPYWGLRDYGTGKWTGGLPDCDHTYNHGAQGTTGQRADRTFTAQAVYKDECRRCGAKRVDKQIGLEATPQEFVAKMVEVFEEVRRVLKPDGTCWINLGDSYAANRGYQVPDGKFKDVGNSKGAQVPNGLKPKDLVGIPWRVAFALQDAGWWLRSDIIWCLSGGAWLYARTQKGDMPIMVKDLVRLNPATIKLWNGSKWTQALGWSHTESDEKIELVLRSGERIGCTGAHQWPTQRGNVPAREIVLGDIIDSCTIPEPDDASCPPYLTPNALWLVGLYLAEGNINDDLIQLSLHADELHWLPRIEAIANHYGAGCTHTLDGNNLCVRLYGRVLATIIAIYIGGSNAHEKHLKVSCWSLPNTSLRQIATGYLDGDGHNDSDNQRVRLGFCRNYSLERDLRTLAARLSATITLNPVMARGFNKEFPAFKGEWRWIRSGHRNERSRNEIVEIRASRARHFWDIGVEDEPHLFALASGVLTHNSKPAPMPESVTDRPTRSHEYIFLLAKSERYYCNMESIKEPSVADHGSGNGYKRESRLSFSDHNGARSSDEPWKPTVKARSPAGWKTGKGSHGTIHPEGREQEISYGQVDAELRNKRDVWTVNSDPFPEAHFATFPPALILPCVLAGCPAGGTIMDPFSGAGTTAMVAKENGRKGIGIELNEEYVEMSVRRLSQGVLAF